jgi:DNA excision repair protein ERCC-3
VDVAGIDPNGTDRRHLGRLLRPKQSAHTTSFYTLIARNTVDQDFAQNRQRFLAEQGYAYTILDAHGIGSAA